MQVGDVRRRLAAFPEAPLRADLVGGDEGEVGVVHVAGGGRVEIDRAVEGEGDAAVAFLASAHLRMVAAGAEMHQHHVGAILDVERAHFVRRAGEQQFLHGAAVGGDGVADLHARGGIAVQAFAAPVPREGLEAIEQVRFGGRCIRREGGQGERGEQD